MKSSIKKALYTSLAAVFFTTSGCGYYLSGHSKEWINTRIENAIVQYQSDDQQWTKQKFEAKISLDQLTEAFNSTYLIANNCHFKKSDGTEIEETIPGYGSGILLKGGYYLTARHVTNPVSEGLEHPIYGTVTYDHSKFSLSDEVGEEGVIEKWGIEKIITGLENIDYSLFKIKDKADLPFYSSGLNLSKKVEVGMRSITIGFPLVSGRNVRLGNISQTKSDVGEDYLTFGNNVVPADSGGPVFVVEDGEVKLAALATMGRMAPNGQIVNINYGIKVSSIIKDMEEQLASGKLDEKTAKEVKNFLELNK